MSDDIDVDRPLLDAIGATLDEPAVVTSFVLITEYMDSDGDRRLYVHTRSDQRCHTTLGLLAYVEAVERERAVRACFMDDEP